MLITGVSGLLGNNIAYYFKNEYEILGLYNSNPVIISGVCTERCDISNGDSIKKIISEFNPSVIIHSASLTNIDQCEMDRDSTWKVNVLGTKYLVESIQERDVKLIYISTDAVYDGDKGNYSEYDDIIPLNYYGFSKYEGEAEVAKKVNSLIFRTNIFGWNIQDKKSLGEWILGELKVSRNINGFKDAYFSSIYTIEFARVIDIAIRKNLSGVYNCGSSDSCSKYEFARKIADSFGLDRGLISPISIDESKLKVKRGKRLTLNVYKIQEALDYRLPTIEQSIDSFYRDYMCGLPEKIKHDDRTPQQKHTFMPYGRQCIDENDIQAVVRSLRSSRITQGPKVEQFEEALAEYCGAKYAVAVSSGTAALHIACLAAGIIDADEVITSPITFIASANCILYCGGKPIFADIQNDSCNINPAEIKTKINPATKAIIPVHFAGLPCDMEEIKRIANEHGLMIIEDACHALGAEWQDSAGRWHKVGSCSHSDMTVFSFHPVKHITTGEGGAVVTNSPSLYEKLLLLRNHGITKKPERFICKDWAFSSNAEVNPWYYEMQELGFNYRITDMQCALGLSQLKKLDWFISKRREIAGIYNKTFSNTSLIVTLKEPHGRKSAYHLYVIRTDFDKAKKSRSALMNKLKDKGIGTQVHYIPVHLQPYYTNRFNYKEGDYPVAEDYYKKALSLPMFPDMSDENVIKVINSLKDCLNVR